MPRFLLVAGTSRDGVTRPAWPDLESPARGTFADDGSWVSWRLTGDNHRELGRSVCVFPDDRAASESIEQLRTSIADLESLIAASTRDGRWAWRVLLGGKVVAASGRPYSRHRECIYNLEAFIAGLADAVLAGKLSHRALPAGDMVTPDQRTSNPLDSLNESTLASRGGRLGTSVGQPRSPMDSMAVDLVNSAADTDTPEYAE